MRGAEMDDVIFGGTASRPQRNMAEVLLSLDNQQRTAPALFNNEEELEVSRKIERDKGSTYRVNGKECVLAMYSFYLPTHLLALVQRHWLVKVESVQS